MPWDDIYSILTPDLGFTMFFNHANALNGTGAPKQGSVLMVYTGADRGRALLGKTNDEILNYFAQRYGRQVLETPPATGWGSLVWIAPVLATAAAVMMLTMTFRRRRGRSGAAPSSEDVALVTAALADRRDAGASPK
jgi:hypothetical protein